MPRYGRRTRSRPRASRGRGRSCGFRTSASSTASTSPSSASRPTGPSSTGRVPASGPEGIRCASVTAPQLQPIARRRRRRAALARRLGRRPDRARLDGRLARAFGRRARRRSPRAGVTTLCLGGDHTVLLAELRALAAVHGPLAPRPAGRAPRPLGRVLRPEALPRQRRAARARGRPDRPGAVGPGRPARLAGRGEDADLPAGLGFDALPYEELAALGPGGLLRARPGARRTAAVLPLLRHRLRRPGLRAGTGTPEVGGPSSREALTYVRSLAGLDFRGFDCVEVSPPFDPAGVTAFVAANACFEMLSLLALRR